MTYDEVDFGSILSLPSQPDVSLISNLRVLDVHYGPKIELTPFLTRITRKGNIVSSPSDARKKDGYLL